MFNFLKVEISRRKSVQDQVCKSYYIVNISTLIKFCLKLQVNVLVPDSFKEIKVPSPTTTERSSEKYGQFYCYYYVQFGIIDIFTENFELVGSPLLDKVLALVVSCIAQGRMRLSYFSI